MSKKVNQDDYDVSKFKEAFPAGFITVIGIRRIEIMAHGRYHRHRIAKLLKDICFSFSHEYLPVANLTRIEVVSGIKILKKEPKCHGKKRNN